MIVRAETPADYAALRALELAAFAPSTVEAEIADRLRAAGDHLPELCLVAEDDGLVGHVMLSRAHVEQHPVLALGPIAVDPARQRQGIGSALMHAAIERAGVTDYPLIALLGHPAYYPRFGFVPAEAELHLTTTYDVPADVWMALPLPAYSDDVRGAFRYAEAFGS